MSQYRKDPDEIDRAGKSYEDSTKASEQGKADAQDSGARRAGIVRTDNKVDAAVSAQQMQDKLQRNPPPLVHVDPSTGKPIDRPFSPGGGATAEPNQLTTPGAPDKPTVAGNAEKKYP